MRVKELLKSKGMTARELASRLGVSEASLSLTIRQGSNPSLQTLQRIADALDVPMSALFDPAADSVLVCPHCGREMRLHASAD